MRQRRNRAVYGLAFFPPPSESYPPSLDPPARLNKGPCKFSVSISSWYFAHDNHSKCLLFSDDTINRHQHLFHSFFSSNSCFRRKQSWPTVTEQTSLTLPSSIHFRNHGPFEDILTPHSAYFSKYGALHFASVFKFSQAHTARICLTPSTPRSGAVSYIALV